MDLDLVRRFRTLLDGCLHCGCPCPPGTCPDCGGATLWPPPGVPPAAAPLGHLVQGGLAFARRNGVVVELYPDRVGILKADTTTTTLAVGKFKTVRVPAGLDRVGSVAGALAAATTLDLPDRVRAALWQRALAYTGGLPSAYRALAADCAALGQTTLLAGLPLSAGEQTWWRARSLWVRGQWHAAAAELLTLPAGRYPQRLVMWWRAVAGQVVPEPLRPAIAMAARELAGASPAARITADLLLRSLGVASAAGEADLVAAARQVTGPQRLARWWDPDHRGGAGGVPARLLAVWSGAAAPPDDPSLLDAAGPAVLDDLLDQGRVTSWSDRFQDLACARQLRARLAISTLDDADLAPVGAHEERARRSLLAGKPLPEDLPPAVAARFTRLRAALDGDTESLVRVAGAAGMAAAPLRAALADEPPAVPDTALLADESLAQWLLRRCRADPAAWPADDLTPPQRRFAAMLALRQARGLLYRWDWEGAREAARTCLRFARGEELRDEAHNLLAAAHWQLGNDQAASAALSAALDGEYTAALQVNYAVVAAELEPQQTAAHLSRLVLEAPNLPLRISAAYQAVRLWRSDQQWQHGESLPAAMAQALRGLVVEDLEYPVFRDLIRLLATHDSAWLARAGSLADSPHRESPAARVWVANARDPQEFVTALATELRGDPEAWLTELRDQLLQDLVRQLNPPGPDTPWTYGVLLFDKRMPMSPEQRVVVFALTVNGLLSTLDPSRSEPALGWVGWLEEAAGEVLRLPSEQADKLRPLLDIPASALTDTYLTSRRHQLAQAYELYQRIEAEVRPIPSHMLNRDGVRRAAEPATNLCQETRTLLRRLRRHAPAPLQPAITELDGLCQQLITLFRQLYA